MRKNNEKSFQMQSRISALLNAFSTSIQREHWRDIAESLDELSHLDPNEALKPSAVLQVFYKHLNNTENKLSGPIRAKIYRLFAAYSFAFKDQDHLITKTQKNEWQNKMMELLDWVQTAVTANPNTQYAKDNLPYLHEYAYHLTCAAAVVQLTPDTHKVDHIKHLKNAASIVGSYFHLCEGHASELGIDFYEWAKARLSDRSTAYWYEKVFILTAYNARILKIGLTNETQRIALNLLRRLTKENEKYFPDWQIIYACIEGLESVLLKLTNPMNDWKFGKTTINPALLILKGGYDPEYSDKELMGLEKLHHYDDTVLPRSNAWCIKSRLIQMEIVLSKNAQRNFVKAWALSILENRKKARIAEELTILQNPPQTWSEHLATLKSTWPLEASVVAAAQIEEDRKQTANMLTKIQSMVTESQHILKNNHRSIDIEKCLDNLATRYKALYQIPLTEDKEVAIHNVFIPLTIESLGEIDSDNIAEKLTQLFSPTGKSPVRSVLVLGETGMGKTTLFQFIVNQWAMGVLRQQYRGIFLIPLKNVNKSRYDKNDHWMDIINRECFQNKLSPQEKEALKHEIINNKDQFLILLDGFDTLSEEEKNITQHRLSYLITPLNELHHVSRCLISTRPNVPVYFKTDARVSVKGFNQDNVRKYIAYFFTHVAHTQSKYIIQILYEHMRSLSTHFSIAHIPQVLLHIVRLASEKYLESRSLFSLTELFDDVIHLYLRNYLINNGKATEHTQKDDLQKKYAMLFKILETIAFYHMIQHHPRITKSHLQIAIDLCLPKEYKHKGEDFLNACVNCGLLKAIPNKSGDDYEFISLTIQEYLAAHNVAHFIKKEKYFEIFQDTFLKNRFNPKFKMVWQFVAGQLENNKSALEKFFGLLQHKDFLTTIKLWGNRSTEDKNNEHELMIRCLAECHHPQLIAPTHSSSATRGGICGM